MEAVTAAVFLRTFFNPPPWQYFQPYVLRLACAQMPLEWGGSFSPRWVMKPWVTNLLNSQLCANLKNGFAPIEKQPFPPLGSADWLEIYSNSSSQVLSVTKLHTCTHLQKIKIKKNNKKKNKWDLAERDWKAGSEQLTKGLLVLHSLENSVLLNRIILDLQAAMGIQCRWLSTRSKGRAKASWWFAHISWCNQKQIQWWLEYFIFLS